MKIPVGRFDKLLRRFGYYLVIWEMDDLPEGYCCVTHIGICKVGTKPE